MNRLLLGSGIFRRDGWKTLDADKRLEPDFLATIPPLPHAVKAIHWDEIEWIHGITSLHPWDAADVLREIHSVIVPGGKLVLEQPDFDKARTRPEWLFGDPLQRNPLIMNRWSWSPEALTAALHEAGFSNSQILHAIYHRPERDFRIEAFA